MPHCVQLERASDCTFWATCQLPDLLLLFCVCVKEWTLPHPPISLDVLSPSVRAQHQFAPITAWHVLVAASTAHTNHPPLMLVSPLRPSATGKSHPQSILREDRPPTMRTASALRIARVARIRITMMTAYRDTPCSLPHELSLRISEP